LATSQYAREWDNLHGWALYARGRQVHTLADARARFEVAAATVPLTSSRYALYAGVETAPRFELVAGGSEVAAAL